MSGPDLPFSARHGASRRQIDGDFPGPARVGLLHLLYAAVRQDYVGGWPEIARELQRIGRVAPSEYGYSQSETARALADAEVVLNELSWDKVFDFCERLHNHLGKEVGDHDEDGEYHVKTSRGDVQAWIARELQLLFAEEGLAFEFAEGKVRRKGRKHTVDVLARADVVLGDRRLSSARRHYDKAVQFFRHPTKPDYENVIKEAVCTVEAAGKALFPEAKAATLGDLAKWFVSNQHVRMPKALAQLLTGVYAFRSGADGVGHGGGTGGAATQEAAEYILSVCASQVIYLVDLDRSREHEVPF